MLTALLAPQLASVNMVNAPVICRDRDIRVSETRRAEPGDYQTLIRVVVTPNGPPAERRPREVSGTLFGGDKPRLISVEGIPLEAELGGNMLFVRNLDKPGFIGALGQTMGAAVGQYRDLPPRPHRAGPGRDLPCRGRSADLGGDPRYRARPAQCDPGQVAAVLGQRPSRFSVCCAPG